MATRPLVGTMKKLADEVLNTDGLKFLMPRICDEGLNLGTQDHNLHHKTTRPLYSRRLKQINT
jgi:hypothetical protein